VGSSRSGACPPIRVEQFSAGQHAEHPRAYRTANDGRLRIRALLVPLAAQRDFFERSDQRPGAVRSIVGAHVA
jgi:hypothetical protein